MDGGEYFTPEEIEKIIGFCYSSISELLTLSEKDGRYQALYNKTLEYTDAVIQINMLIKDLSTENKTHKSVGDAIKDLLENKHYGSLGKYIEYLEQKSNKKVPQDIQHYRTALQLFSSGIIQHLKQGDEQTMDVVFNSESTEKHTIERNVDIIYSELKDIHHLGKKLKNGEHISDKEILDCKDKYDYLTGVYALDKDHTQLLDDICQQAEKQLNEDKPKSNISSCASFLFFMGNQSQKSSAKSYITKDLKKDASTNISCTLKQ